MSRQRSSKNEWKRYKKFEQENERLRKEVSKLRKVVNNLVIDQLEERANKVENGQSAITPICEICGNDDLHSVPIKRPDGEFEIKVCKSCSHRSSMKKVKENTQGV